MLHQIIVSCTTLYLRPQLSAQLDFAASSAGLLNILICILICLCKLVCIFMFALMHLDTKGRWLACLFILGRPFKASERYRK